MTNFRARIVTAITTTLLAACGQSASVTAPDSALYDGGHTFGGGNKSDTTTTTTATSGAEDAAITSGGYTYGGGN